MQACRKEGLSLQTERFGPLVFTLVSTPYLRLCREAERIQLSFPLKDILTQIDVSKELEGKKEKVCDDPSPPLISDEPLKRRGLEYLRMKDVYHDAFILHDPSKEEPYFKKMEAESLSDYTELVSDINVDSRKDMYSIWKRWAPQPLSHIRDYFGEEGTFLTLLWTAAILGILSFIYGIVKSVRSSPSDIGNCSNTDPSGTVNLIPCNLQTGAMQVISTVSSWLLMSFDNELNAFFAVFMSIWGSTFYQIWRRNNSVLSYEWDCEEHYEIEPDRPEYVGSKIREDPVTGENEWISPQVSRYLKMLLSAVIVGMCMCLVVISVLAVTVFKLWMISANGCSKEYTFTCSLLTTYLPSFLNTSSTMLFGWGYDHMVTWLNHWENHRTRSEHNNSLIVKLFAFQMVNNYTSLFYVAFVRPDRNHLQENGLFGLGIAYRDVCDDGTCGTLLAVQLLSHMLIKPIPKFTKDIIIPFVATYFRRSYWLKRRQTSIADFLEESDQTNVLIREWMKPSAGNFVLWEFNEKLLQFGTTMMFASLFPLAPLIALLIGLVDLKIDAHRLTWFNRRPVPVNATGIGIWLPIMFFIQYFAVMTNAFIIAFTSDFCTNFFSNLIFCDVKGRLIIVIVFQNAVFVLKYVIQSMIPAVPASIRVAQRRKRYVISHIIEKGDVPYKIKMKKRTRKAKLAWITSRASGLGHVAAFHRTRDDSSTSRANLVNR